jgi:hypothetical protein
MFIKSRIKIPIVSYYQSWAVREWWGLYNPPPLHRGSLTWYTSAVGVGKRIRQVVGKFLMKFTLDIIEFFVHVGGYT